MICTSPRFSESIVMSRNLIYLMKTSNVYNLYVETIFHVDACHYPLYCLTKRHDNEEEDLKLWTHLQRMPWITSVRSDKKITTIQRVKSQLIVLIKDLYGKFNIRLSYSCIVFFASVRIIRWGSVCIIILSYDYEMRI